MNIEELKPNLVAFAGDWHCNSGYAMRAVKYAVQHGAGVIVHVGDFLGFQPETERYILSLEQKLAFYGIHLYFVDGNHEDFPYIESLPLDEDGTQKASEHIHYLPRGFRWNWQGTSFLALGGATSVDRDRRTLGRDFFPQEQISLKDQYKAVEGGYADVMVCHDVPIGTDVPPFKGTPWTLPEHILATAKQHREVLGSVVDAVAPAYLFHGHYHNRYSTTRTNPNFTKTKIIGLDCDGWPFEDNVSLFSIGGKA